MSNDRFSVLLLEKDVLEYHNYKLKYNDYEQQLRNCDHRTREDIKTKRDYYYKKYISKMKYLEENYRKTNIYTRYHAQLESGYKPQNPVRPPVSLPPIAARLEQEVTVAEPIVATVVEPVDNIVLPSAPILEEVQAPVRIPRRVRDARYPENMYS